MKIVIVLLVITLLEPGYTDNCKCPNKPRENLESRQYCGKELHPDCQPEGIYSCLFSEKSEMKMSVNCKDLKTKKPYRCYTFECREDEKKCRFYTCGP
jgi:hypothetical protein